jgi:hypothetical protein
MCQYNGQTSSRPMLIEWIRKSHSGGNSAGKLRLSDPEQTSERNNQKRLPCPTRYSDHDDTEKMLDPPTEASNNTIVFNLVRSLAK